MSRAQLLDERDEDAVENNEQVEEQESQEEVAQASNLPEKYQGKSLEEIVQMHQEAEKLLGKQSSEVGELRKLVDEHIQAQLAQKQAPEQQQEDDEIDFFVDPKKAISRAIENHPKIKEAQQYSNEYKKQSTMSQLQANHPDMQDILQSQGFVDWVKASKIRTQLFVQADQQYDFDAADELFSLWKERSQVANKTADAEKQVRRQQVKTASTGNARGSGEKQRKKVYRRADIIKLMKTDPERYQTLSDDIFRAYAEGRVK